MTKIFNCGDQVGSSTVNTISVVKIRSYRWLNIWNIVKEPLIVRTELKNILHQPVLPQALRRWKSEEIYCRLFMSVNAEESLGRENKGDKCLLRFCLPLTTRKKKQQVALKLGHLKPRLYGEIQLTLDNSNLALTQTKIAFPLDFLHTFTVILPSITRTLLTRTSR